MHTGLAKFFSFRRSGRNSVSFPELFAKFQAILDQNNRILDLVAGMGDKLGGEYIFDRHYIETATDELVSAVADFIADFCVLTQKTNKELVAVFETVLRELDEELTEGQIASAGKYVFPLQELRHDMSEQAGTKMANLGDVSNRLELYTPDGFVITSRAFREFLHDNDLLDLSAEANTRWQQEDHEGLREHASLMQERIRHASLSAKLTSSILAEFDRLVERVGKDDLKVAVRSSAWGEDGASSFAGQYQTILNVGRNQLIDSYREVIASAYCYEGLQYRLLKGYHEYETAIAVGCQLMVSGQVSGVLHTFAPHIAEDAMIINATWGLGSSVLQGDLEADTIILDRAPPYKVLRFCTALKTRRLVTDPRGGTSWQDTPESLKKSLSLSEQQLDELGQAGMSIERYFRRPKEIEWSYDQEGVLQILQVRPLLYRGIRGALSAPKPPAIDMTHNAEVIFSGRGYVAQCGVAVGKVHIVENDEDLETFPHGGILVSKFSSPRYSRVMHKARGIITDLGSVTGHMSTLAREYRVPAIVNAEVATGLLREGEEITIDGAQNVVYRGNLYTLDHFDLTEEEVFQDSFEYRLLYRILKKITPLTILDTRNGSLTPRACRSLHDIIRYIQEKAVEELVELSERQNSKGIPVPKRLRTTIPLGLTVIDAGGGTSCSLKDRLADPDQITCRPLQELLFGLEKLGMWCTEPVAVDLGSFMASFTRTFPTTLAQPKEVGINLAVVRDNYLNFSVRLGYHYSAIDAVIAEEIDENYIYFRFFGGVTEFVRRSRRVACIARILEAFDFRVEIHGDLVAGRLKKMTMPRMAQRMRMLGGLVGYTRQLDACMHSDQDISNHAAVFIDAMNRVIGE